MLEGVPVDCVAADGDRVIVGTRGAGALLSSGRRTGDGSAWSCPSGTSSRSRSALRTERSTPARNRVACSPFATVREWTELEALQDIPSRERWSFPPRPWTHHVRWIAPDPHRPERLLVAIELGGVMLSEDGGESFSDHRPGAKRDAHTITWHPLAEGRAYEAAGDGAAWSEDGGAQLVGARCGA